MMKCTHPFCDCECKGYCNASNVEEQTLSDLVEIGRAGDLTEVINSGFDLREEND